MFHNERAQRHAGVEQGQGGGAHRAHGGRAVGAQGLGDLADGVGEVITVDFLYFSDN